MIILEIKIRNYICNNFKNSDKKEIEDSIVSSIASKEDIVLPGLGVFFEILWQNSDHVLKDSILNTLESHIKG